MNRAIAVVLAILVLAEPSLGQSGVVLFPTIGRPFAYPIGSSQTDGAVGRVVRVGRGESRFGAETEADVSIGENLPVLGFPGPLSPFIGLTIRVTGRFSLDDPKSSLISNDWVVGLHAVADRGPWRVAAELYHESSHLGDEYSNKFGVTRVDWTREVAALWLRRRLSGIELHARAGVTLVDELPLNRGALGLGADYHGGIGNLLGARMTPYAGLFVEWVGYANWSSTTTARAGVEVKGQGHHSIGLGFAYLNGLSPQRQFYSSRSRYLGFELRFGW